MNSFRGLVSSGGKSQTETSSQKGSGQSHPFSQWEVTSPGDARVELGGREAEQEYKGSEAHTDPQCPKRSCGASLAVQWLGIHLPRQGTWVPSLIWEDPTCRGPTNPVCHSY